jgi:hypothetical protein
MTAADPTADIAATSPHVAFVPIADIGTPIRSPCRRVRAIPDSCTASKFYIKDRRLELMFPDLDAHTDHVTCSYPSYRLVVLSLLTVRKN